ncbi:MAG: PEGA domain-containing protein [Myxococcales bacterium]|nr:PEGA domain-containing protein [Myxococcales bacterium]
MTRAIALLIGLLLLSVDVFAATADDVAEARRLGQEAAVAFRDKRFDEALELFQQANALVPHANLEVNVGRSYEALGQFDLALVHCKMALNAPGVPAPTRAAALQCVERVAEKLVRPMLHVNSKPPGATIRIDGREVGRTPFRGEVDPGIRKIDLELEGFGPSSRTIMAERGDIAPLNITLTPSDLGGLLTVLSTPAGARIYLDKDEIGRSPLRNFPVDSSRYELEVILEGYAPDLKTITVSSGKHLEQAITLVPIGGRVEPSGPRPSWPGWALLGSSAAALGVAGYFGLAAIDSHGKADELARTSGSALDRGRYDRLRSDFESQRFATDLSVVAGTVLLTSGLTYLLWPDSSPKPAAPVDPAASSDEEMDE